MSSHVANISFAEALKKSKKFGFGNFLEIVSEISQESTKKGLIDRKNKEFIVLAIAFAKNCNRCIEIHSEDALKQGASEAEIAMVKKIALHAAAEVSMDNRLWSAWKSTWVELSMSKGAIERRYRELIAVGIALVQHNGPMIEYHTKAAMNLGASAEEVFEVMPVALLMEGAPALSQLTFLVAAINESHEQYIAREMPLKLTSNNNAAKADQASATVAAA